MVISLIVGPLEVTQMGVQHVLVLLTFSVNCIDGLDIKAIYIWKYTHSMAMGSFLQYNV